MICAMVAAGIGEAYAVNLDALFGGVATRCVWTIDSGEGSRSRRRSISNKAEAAVFIIGERQNTHAASRKEKLRTTTLCIEMHTFKTLFFFTAPNCHRRSTTQYIFCTIRVALEQISAKI